MPHTVYYNAYDYNATYSIIIAKHYYIYAAPASADGGGK